MRTVLPGCILLTALGIQELRLGVFRTPEERFEVLPAFESRLPSGQRPGQSASSEPEQVNTRSLVWMDRQGREEPTGAPARTYLALRLAPDGTRVTLDIRDQQDDIWVWDLARRTMQKLTFGTALDIFPIWTPGQPAHHFQLGQNRHARSLRAGGRRIGCCRASDDGQEHPYSDLYSARCFPGTSDRSRRTGGRHHVAVTGRQGSDSTPGGTPFRERNAAISPDGRWVAYESDESGALQVFVRPFPDVNAGRWLLSPRGGAKPSWSRNGRELFYVDSEGALVSIPVETTPAFRAGDPVKLFDLRSVASLTNGRPYDVTPDGQRFIVIREPPPEATVSKVPQIVVVLNWLSEMQGKSKDP